MAPSLAAVVVAAGRGLRFLQSSSAQTNKVLVPIKGSPIIRQTLEALFELPIHQLCVVIRDEERALFESALAGFGNSHKIVYAQGGERRQDSVRSGIEALEATDFVLVHDGARPFLRREFLFSLWDKAQTSDALVPAQEITETLKEISPDGYVIRTVDRRAYVRVQTPQFFRSRVLKEAHEKFKNSRLEFTDDAAMVEALGVQVQVARGSRENVKVTVANDLEGAERV